MAKFVFSMQNILSMKEKLEEQEKAEYSQVMMRFNEEQEKLNGLMERQGMAEVELRNTINEVLDVQEIREKEDFLEIIKVYVKEQQLVLLACEEEVRQARERLNEAMKERKIYEKLREKAFEEFMLEENKREQKEIDELVSYRFGNIKSED